MQRNDRLPQARFSRRWLSNLALSVAEHAPLLAPIRAMLGALAGEYEHGDGRGAIGRFLPLTARLIELDTGNQPISP